MFEFRLRILDARESGAGPNSFLGIVEGFPEILVHATSIGQTETDLVNALADRLHSLLDLEATRLELDGFPMVLETRLVLCREAQ
jgi:hypothetical protein